MAYGGVLLLSPHLSFVPSCIGCCGMLISDSTQLRLGWSAEQFSDSIVVRLGSSTFDIHTPLHVK